MSKGTRFHINPFLNELLLYLATVSCHGAYHPIHWFWSHIIIFEDEIEEPIEEFWIKGDILDTPGALPASNNFETCSDVLIPVKIKVQSVILTY